MRRPSREGLRALYDQVFKDLPSGLSQLRAEVALLREALGRVEGRLSAANPSPRLNDHEFRVFSQFGEDGILQNLVQRVVIDRRYFVEFGVEDYTQANTRWLMLQDGWQGLVLDGSELHVEAIRHSRAAWSNGLTAVAAFITRENINELIGSAGVSGRIGVLSVDIDGNDYWVWEALTIVDPAIVVVEYNHRFGPERSVVVPYDAGFVRRDAHWSHVYYGASLSALCGLAQRKGYAFVGCGSAGVNAFFVRSDALPPDLPELTPRQGYVAAQVREATDEQGRYTYLTTEQELALVDHLKLVEVPGPF